MKKKSVITIEAKEEIRKNIAELKEVLKDDKEFAEEIVDKILSLGPGMYRDTIQHSIAEKYPNLNDLASFEHSNNVDMRGNLNHIIYDLSQIMGGKKSCNEEETDNLSEKEYEEYLDMLAENVKDEIYDSFYENSVESLNVADMN